MLNDATGFKTVYIVDLRSGMDRLAALIEAQTGNRPYVADTLYLFCGRRTDRIKGLVWEGDGWLLLYKRLSEMHLEIQLLSRVEPLCGAPAPFIKVRLPNTLHKQKTNACSDKLRCSDFSKSMHSRNGISRQE